MDARLQSRVQRYGWDLAAARYERLWGGPLATTQTVLVQRAALKPGARALRLGPAVLRRLGGLISRKAALCHTLTHTSAVHTERASSTKPVNTMPKFVIERSIPQIGAATAAEMQAISQKSCLATAPNCA